MTAYNRCLLILVCVNKRRYPFTFPTLVLFPWGRESLNKNFATCKEENFHRTSFSRQKRQYKALIAEFVIQNLQIFTGDIQPEAVVPVEKTTFRGCMEPLYPSIRNAIGQKNMIFQSEMVGTKDWPFSIGPCEADIKLIKRQTCVCTFQLLTHPRNLPLVARNTC